MYDVRPYNAMQDQTRPNKMTQNLRMKIQFSPSHFPKTTLNGLMKIEFSYEDSESVEGF